MGSNHACAGVASTGRLRFSTQSGDGRCASACVFCVIALSWQRSAVPKDDEEGKQWKVITPKTN